MALGYLWQWLIAGPHAAFTPRRQGSFPLLFSCLFLSALFYCRWAGGPWPRVSEAPTQKPRPSNFVCSWLCLMSRSGLRYLRQKSTDWHMYFSGSPIFTLRIHTAENRILSALILWLTFVHSLIIFYWLSISIQGVRMLMGAPSLSNAPVIPYHQGTARPGSRCALYSPCSLFKCST